MFKQLFKGLKKESCHNYDIINGERKTSQAVNNLSGHFQQLQVT